MRRLLFVAYHFPPIQGSSGIQRTLSFARNLPEFGWQPTVLTVNERAYENVSPESNALVPDTTPVIRSCAFDAARHLAVGGRYLDALAVPDRWQSWLFAGIVQGLRAVRRNRLELVVSTYPIATAHIIGYAVSRLAGIPWVADLRDPMLQNDFPRGRMRRWSFAQIERLIVRHAKKIILTTPGAAALYRERYGAAVEGKVEVIQNGYDENIFPERMASDQSRNDRPMTLIHSGLLYRQERDPTNFLAAVRDLIETGLIARDAIRIIFRAPGGEIDFDAMLARYDLQDVVEVRTPIPYQQALSEMLQADGLLIFQADNCNRQIPAKLYEYVYARVPILAITDPAGDTGTLLRSIGVESVARLESYDDVRAMLATALPKVRDGTLAVSTDDQVASLSRRVRSRELAGLLNEIATGGTSPTPHGRVVN